MLKSVFEQTFHDFQVLIVDNASRDSSIESIRTEYPNVHILRNSSNLGYSRAHNQGLQLQHSEYTLIMNPDIILMPDFLINAVRVLDADQAVAAVCGKLRRFHFSNSDLREVIDDGIIDATGLVVKRSFQVQNRDAGVTDNGQADEPNDTFGASGALALFRRAALETVRLQGKVFDEALFAYKEDVDLAWRLQRAGWRTRYEPQAMALHFREAKDSVRAHHRAIARARKSKSALVNYLSYRNQALVVLKNVPAKNMFRHLPRVLWYELQKFFYILIFEPKTLGAIGDIIKLMPQTLAQRRLIARHAKRNADELEQWIQ